MPRQAHHSKNWGGARNGAGTPRGRKNTGPNRMTKRAIEMAESAKIHPLEFLLSVVADKRHTIRDRLNASAAALPYCLSKKATEIHVTNELAGKSDTDLRSRLVTIQTELLQLDTVIEGEAVEVK